LHFLRTSHFPLPFHFARLTSLHTFKFPLLTLPCRCASLA
jgi:hypothetical protein